MPPNFDVAEECRAIRTEIKSVNDGVHALGLGLARVETRLTAHEERHDRDDAVAAIRARRGDSNAPRRSSSLDLGTVAKVAAGIGIAIAVGLSAYTSSTAPDAGDVNAAAKAAASAIVEVAKHELREVAAEVVPDTDCEPVTRWEP